jgi:hypothetical protein
MSLPFWEKTIAYVSQNPIPTYNFEVTGDTDYQTITCSSIISGLLYTLKSNEVAPSTSGYTTTPVVMGMASLLGEWTDKEFTDKLGELFNAIDSVIRL